MKVFVEVSKNSNLKYEYDKKNNRLTHYFEESLEKGKHEFELEVIDNKQNINTYKAIFYY